MLLGSSQPRNCPTRVPTLCQVFILFVPVQCTAWRLDCSLHPVNTRHHTPSAKGRLQFHPGCGRLPGPVLRLGRLHRHPVAANVQTRPEKTVQSMEVGYLAENSAKRLSDRGAVCSTEERRRRCGVLVCYICGCGWGTVSFQTSGTSRCGASLTVVGRLVGGVVYWYLWTVLIPRLRGYHLEEETDVLKDGTSITRLVKVKNQ